MVPEVRRLSDEQLRRASALLQQRCGLRFDAANRALLEEGLYRAADAENSSAAELLDLLDREPTDALVQSVLRQVTIGETYFFRHPEHFAALTGHVLRERLLARGPAEPLRAWSAGCATGEEAWSLLMTLHAAGRRALVLGTDINKAALHKARSGRYAGWSIRNELSAPPGLLRQRDGNADVAPWLHAHAHFDYLNLNDPIYPSLFTGTQGLDIIFCRNVLVYFAPAAAERVLERLADCLADGGWMVVSALDLESAPTTLERVPAAGVTLLRKPARPPRPPATVALTHPELLAAAHEAAERGAIGEAIERARQALGVRRSPAALHLLALLMGERGDDDERLALLREVASRAPHDVLARLGLGLSEKMAREERTAHLKRALALTEGRPDEPLGGPDPLPAGWVRKVAAATLRRLDD
jgi:chemotaxis protein methyltransferase CheR